MSRGGITEALNWYRNAKPVYISTAEVDNETAIKAEHWVEAMGDTNAQLSAKHWEKAMEVQKQEVQTIVDSIIERNTHKSEDNNMSVSLEEITAQTARVSENTTDIADLKYKQELDISETVSLMVAWLEDNENSSLWIVEYREKDVRRYILETKHGVITTVLLEDPKMFELSAEFNKWIANDFPRIYSSKTTDYTNGNTVYVRIEAVRLPDIEE